MRPENRFGKKVVRNTVPREGGSFEVGRHVVRLLCLERRWAASVDGGPASPWCDSQADAWADGVHEADRLDRLAAAPAQAALPPFSHVAGVSTG